MNTIKLNPLLNNFHTSVPNWFIDHYMLSSNGDFVKVYLLLLRYSSSSLNELTTSTFADVLNLTDSDILRAFKFWASKGLLTIEVTNKQISSISLVEPMEIATQALDATGLDTAHVDIASASTDAPFKDTTISSESYEEVPALSGSSLNNQSSEQPQLIDTVHLNLTSKPQYSMEELSNFVASTSYKDLIYVTGRYLGKNLNQNDLSTLISFHDWLGLPVEVIEWLIEYCASNDHRNMRYIEKVAIEWADQNIDTLEKAKLHTETFNKKYYAIKKALGFANRNPVLFEIKTMDKWIGEYKFDLEIILEACNRTMKQAPNGSFNYADKILTQWHKKGVRILEDIKMLDQQHLAKNVGSKKTVTPIKSNNKFINFEQRDYDFEKIEKKAMEMILKENVEGGYN